MIKAVIIDDEKDSIDTLKWKLENYCPDVSVISSFEKPADGVSYLKKNPIDLLFLDIEMPMLTGFDVLEELGRDISFDIIFITAYDNFGIQAVKFSALDYLLKPVQNKELKEAIDKHLKKTQQKIPSEQIDLLLNNVQAERKGKRGRIALASKESIEFVDPNDIVVCEANSNYTNVYLVEGRKRVISKTLKDFEELLPPAIFLRIHKSYIVNRNFIINYLKKGDVVLSDDARIPVSRRKKTEVSNILLNR